MRHAVLDSQHIRHLPCDTTGGRRWRGILVKGMHNTRDGLYQLASYTMRSEMVLEKVIPIEENSGNVSALRDDIA